MQNMAICPPPPREKVQSMIRPATEADVPAIVHVGITTFTSSFGHSMPEADLQAYLSEAYHPGAIQSMLSDPRSNTFVACDPSDISSVMGFVQLNQGKVEECVSGPKPIELNRFYVDAKFHGSGVGSALFWYVDKLAREWGFETLWLGVWEENLKAQRAYQKFGFSKVGTHDFVMGECVQTDWILTKNLND